MYGLRIRVKGFGIEVLGLGLFQGIGQGVHQY